MSNLLNWLLYSVVLKFAALAQLVEHSAVNRVVAGPSPAGGAIKILKTIL
jgi:hypothetical protein